MWVIKLGGSLADSPNLPLWLNALAETKAVIVPGGGPFADAVRDAQARWQFDELTAHHMAILGMRQYGRMLLGLCPALVPATDIDALRADTGRAKVWLPMPEALDAAGIPASWDITSDSLAAWLAGQIGAEHLLLVKAGDPALEAKEWLDPAFQHYANGPFHSWLCGPGRHADLTQALANPARHFCAFGAPSASPALSAHG